MAPDCDGSVGHRRWRAACGVMDEPALSVAAKISKKPEKQRNLTNGKTAASIPSNLGVSRYLVDRAAFKAVEALYPQRLAGSIPVHSRWIWLLEEWGYVAPV